MLLRPSVESADYPFMFSGIDKVLHLVIFAMLGFCFCAAFPRVKFWTFFQLMIIYSLLTEILQGTMGLGRSLETLDLLADTIGFLLGYLMFIKLKRTIS